MEQLARWNAVHGEAIHGSRPWLICGEIASTTRGVGFGEDLQHGETEIRFATQGPVLYAIALGWPQDGRIVVRSLAKPVAGNFNIIAAVTLLRYDGKMARKQTDNGLTVTLPEKKISEYMVGLKITGTDFKPAPPHASVLNPQHAGHN